MIDVALDYGFGIKTGEELSNQLLATARFSDKEKFKELYEVNKKMTEWIAKHFGELAIE